MKRVKFNGCFMSKFDIANFLNDTLRYRSLPWIVMYDAFSYFDMVSFLKEALSLDINKKYVSSFIF